MENEKPIRNDTSKEKIILFVIGVLVGAVISTGAFFAYIKLAGVGNSSGEQSMQMPGGTPPEMPSGDESGTPPEMPSGDEGNTPPEMPSDQNGGENSDSQDTQDDQNSQSNNAPSKPDKKDKSQTTNS